MPTRYHVAVRHPDDERVLVRHDGAMPGFSLEPAPAWQVVSPIVERLREAPGIEVVVLRAAWLGDGAAPGRSDRLYEAVATHDAPAAGHRWVALADLDRRPTPMGRAIDAGVLDSLAGDRQPWYGIHWFAEMVAWIDERLADAGIRRHGPVQQVRSWGRSALLTLHTDRGHLWAKQVPAVFAHEVAVTGLLADVDPGIVPPLVAADTRSGRLLMEHVEGPQLAEQPEAADAWLATMSRLAEIQRVMAADLGVLRVAGVPAASMAELSARIPSLVTDPALRAATPRLVAACEALDEAATVGGPSLEHGDLSADQVIMGAMGPVFLDWSDATITHPFLAAAAFLGDAAAAPPASLESSLEAAYLSGWSATSHARDVREAQRGLALARVVHPLHMASMLVDRILPGLEQPWELSGMVATYLEAVRPRLETLPRILRG